MATKYLTLTGLQRFYNGFKGNLLTTEIVNKINTAYNYATTTDAEKNVIVGVQVNGADLEVDENRKVNVVVPTKTSDITNDSDFTTLALVAGQHYTKTEIDTTVDGLEEAIAAAAAGKIITELVDAIDVNAKTVTKGSETKAAVANVIYLVPKNPAQTNNIKDEYMLIGDAFEKIGDTEIDLSDYAKTADVTSAIATAKTEAIEAAAADATSKANAARTDAQEYADGLNAKMDTRMQAVEAAVGGIEDITDEDIDALFA